MSEPKWLNQLNPNQLQAVKWPADGSLQILAGPGSGKTRVLTCRVAYLLQECNLSPDVLVGLTFTNKAAKEMKDRLCVLLGTSLASQISLGTFHGLCVNFLRKHGAEVGLQPNWLICDRDQQLVYCKTVLKDARFASQALDFHNSIKPNTLLDFFSKSKSQSLSPEEALRQSDTPYKNLMSRMFRGYEDLLAADNCLDFDDLLLYGERLFRRCPEVIAHVRHVLVDEFQDTNTVQYQMIVLLAHQRALTIVGDPDQGIYGWRNAQIANLQKMSHDFPTTQAIFLEENYRSSSSILKASLAVVQQDQDRIDKSLFTSHPPVTLPMLRPFEKPQDEAAFIAQEIRRLVAYSGGELDYNDFSILMRYNALSRNLEAALQAAGIPSRMVGGQKFFERTEVKDILAYLQLADNPTFTPAFDRIINTPRRNIGAQTTNAIKAACEAHKISPLEVLVQAIRGKSFAGLKPSQNVVFKRFLGVICNIQKMAQEGASVVEIIDMLIDRIDYMGHLQRTFSTEAVQRNQNVQELKAFAIHLAGASAELLTALPSSAEEAFALDPEKQPSTDIPVAESGIDRLIAIIRNNSKAAEEEVTPLRRFLIESSLSTDADTEESLADKTKAKVTISTCHASKGLEWPVVFVTAVEEGIFPFVLCTAPEEIKEERRLLFVAMTRAQGLLYLTHVAERMQGAEIRSQEISQFVKKLKVKKENSKGTSGGFEFDQNPPTVDKALRRQLSAVIGRPMVSQEAVEREISKFESTSTRGFRLPNKYSEGRSSQQSEADSNPRFNRWGANSSKPALGRFSSSAPNNAPPRTPGSFQAKSSIVGFTSAALLARRTSGSSTTASLPVAGRFSSSASTALPRDPGTSQGGKSGVAEKKFKVSLPSQPFVPHAPKNRAATEATIEDKSEADSKSGKPAAGRALADLQTISTSFMSNLKNDIPKDLPNSAEFSAFVDPSLINPALIDPAITDHIKKPLPLGSPTSRTDEKPKTKRAGRGRPKTGGKKHKLEQ